MGGGGRGRWGENHTGHGGEEGAQINRLKEGESRGLYGKKNSSNGNIPKRGPIVQNP